MNILFLTLLDFNSFSEHNIYCDILREFIKKGHSVYAISPMEKRNGSHTHLTENGRLLKLKIGNIQKTNFIEKGISTLLVESKFKRAITKYFLQEKFDLVLYSTPPITLLKAIKFVKNRDNAKTYLMLKDIFPQNAVDLGAIKKRGLTAPIYWYFRRKEKALYNLSDKIGCMSKANVDYIINHNTYLDYNKVEICPNSIEVIDKRSSLEQKKNIRTKYGLPQDKTIYVYGGNLGKPQCIHFFVEALKKQIKYNDRFFLIIGDGTEKHLIQNYIDKYAPENVRLIDYLSIEEYDRLISACDVGLIFLDHRFTIPNFPSRLLGYMQVGLPVLCCTDNVTDIGEFVTNNDIGWSCSSSDLESFIIAINNSINKSRVVDSYKIINILTSNFSVKNAYNLIIKE